MKDHYIQEIVDKFGPLRVIDGLIELSTGRLVRSTMTLDSQHKTVYFRSQPRPNYDILFSDIEKVKVPMLHPRKDITFVLKNGAKVHFFDDKNEEVALTRIKYSKRRVFGGTAYDLTFGASLANKYPGEDLLFATDYREEIFYWFRIYAPEISEKHSPGERTVFLLVFSIPAFLILYMLIGGLFELATKIS